jgi:hypothetical protein
LRDGGNDGAGAECARIDEGVLDRVRRLTRPRPLVRVVAGARAELHDPGETVGEFGFGFLIGAAAEVVVN